MMQQALQQALQETRASRLLLLADTPAVTQTIRCAELCQREFNIAPLVLIESDVPFAPRVRPSTIVVHGMPAGVIATFTVLDQQGIAARLCSSLDLPGCHDGSVIDLARAWLATLQTALLPDVAVMVMGSHELLQRADQLTAEFGVRPVFISSEIISGEFIPADAERPSEH